MEAEEEGTPQRSVEVAGDWVRISVRRRIAGKVEDITSSPFFDDRWDAWSDNLTGDVVRPSGFLRGS